MLKAYDVTDRIDKTTILTGLRVQHVDIEVTTLLTGDRDDDRRVV